MRLEKNRVEINCASIYKMDDDVILIVYKKDFEIGLEDAKEIDDVYVKLSEGKKIFSILDSTNQTINLSPEAQKFLANEGKAVDLLLVSIVVINAMPARLITRIFMSFHKPKFPMKIVKTRDEAYKWINKYRKGH